MKIECHKGITRRDSYLVELNSATVIPRNTISSSSLVMYMNRPRPQPSVQLFQHQSCGNSHHSLLSGKLTITKVDHIHGNFVLGTLLRHCWEVVSCCAAARLARLCGESNVFCSTILQCNGQSSFHSPPSSGPSTRPPEVITIANSCESAATRGYA